VVRIARPHTCGIPDSWIKQKWIGITDQYKDRFEREKLEPQADYMQPNQGYLILAVADVSAG
jgi:hypothetical protein